MHNAKLHDDLIEPTRLMLKASGQAYVIENVEGSPLLHEMILCGTMFGLGVGDAELWRHRKFETSWQPPLFSVPACRHRTRPRVIGVYGGHGRDRRRGKWLHRDVQDFPASARREAMGIDWMGEGALSQAIPPAYSEYIGRAFLAHHQAIPTLRVVRSPAHRRRTPMNHWGMGKEKKPRREAGLEWGF